MLEYGQTDTSEGIDINKAKKMWYLSLLVFFNPFKTGLLRVLRCWGGPNGPSSVSFDWEVLFTWNLAER